MKKNWLFFILVISSFVVAAQSPPPGVGSGGQSNVTNSENPLLEEEELDTTKKSYFFVDDPTQLFPFRDTLLNDYFQQFDPTRQRDFDYGNLGNLGSAARPIVWQPLIRNGFDVGFHQFDAYQKTAATHPFYVMEKTFSEAFYSQGNSKSISNFGAKFSRNFAHRLSTSVDFFRVNQAGQYQNQRSFNTALSAGVWFESANNRYKLFFIYLNNVMQQLDNGGVSTDVLGIDNGLFTTPISVPVSLQNAITRHAKKEINIHHHYQLRKPADSLFISQRNYTFNHIFSYSEGSYKFSDTKPDSNYYADFQVDDRGLRSFIATKNIENKFSVSTSKLVKNDSSTAAKNDLLEIGIAYNYHRIRQEPTKKNVNNVYIFGKWNIEFLKNIQFQSEINFHILGNNVTDYNVRGNLNFSYRQLGTFHFSLLHQRYAPSLVQEFFYVTENSIWQNNFNRTLQTTLTATLSQPKLRTSISGQYHLLNNHIYYDTAAIVRQYGAPISIIQLLVKQDFTLWRFHLDNVVALQKNSQDAVLRLPEFWSKHSFYAEGHLFKRAMLLRIGADVRLNSSYFADAYQPLVGQYHVQDKLKIAFFPSTDLFLSAKIQNWRFFFKWEGCTQYFFKGTYYQAYRQPQFEESFRFGVKLQLKE